jgi:cyclopropane fatty-acyl-phospholipid synthase-like methyltransferase
VSGLVEDMQVYYARRAPIYDVSMGYDDPAVAATLGGVFASLRRQLAGRLLEIACGPGFWTGPVSEVATSIVATDYTESMLEQARRKRFDERIVSLRIADAYELSNVGGPYDGAFAVDWLAHVPASRMREFLDGVHARLASDARVVFCDQMAGPASWTGLYDNERNHLQERMLPDGSTYRVIKHFPSDDEYCALFSPWSTNVSIERFAECRRVVVGYTVP